MFFMALSCPRCRTPMPWYHRFMSGRWRCEKCDSLLERSHKFQLITLIAYLIIMFSAFSLYKGNYLLFSFICILVLSIMLVAKFLFLRTRVVEPSGAFCEGCGYNLTGDLSEMCPKCGHVISRSSRIHLHAAKLASEANQS